MRYRPSILDNVKHWRVFEDDLQINRFLEMVNGFSSANIDVGAGPCSYRKSCYIGTRKSKEIVPEATKKRAQPLHLRQRRRQEGSATLIKEGAMGRGIKDKVQKGSDRGSGAHTRDQCRKSWKTAGSYGVIGKAAVQSTERPTVTVRVFGYCWDRPIVLYHGETFGPPI